MGNDNRTLGQAGKSEKPLLMVVIEVAYADMLGSVPRITPPLPKFARILRTTAGVKSLTVTDSGWDNADTTRALKKSSLQFKELRKRQKFGKQIDRRGGVLRE